ncbi:wax ester/triacylglycerol synthase domain-containing protein [Streptomyces sp. PT12]|uniref:wax ester/triacylglycerol synthase domain-containing protein n=1 Tax=Streptomyces sp. PT12 TaxID=1510197 RepID=UPI000DE481B7|nr:wax ester/triacylglycerol synthase domain-containing protein [Streptomyces sp. PT12]RBM07382.1 hypothetical protein DEH69_25420 [Streptomyces sp. PT12]
MTARTRLSAVDELLLGHRGTPETIGAAALFSGPRPDLAVLRRRISERWGALPRLGLVLTEPGPPRALRRHTWEPRPGFDAAEHVVETGPIDDIADAFLPLMTRPLPPGRPPWRVLSAPCGDDGFALILAAQHALLDGRSLDILLNHFLDGPPNAPAPDVHAGRTGLRAAADRAIGLARPGHALWEPSGTPPCPAVACAEIPFRDILAARRTAQGRVSFYDMVLAAVGGAVAEVFPGADAPVHALVSMDLRTRATAHRLGNMVTATRVPLPTAPGAPGARLAACHGLVDHSLTAPRWDVAAHLLNASALLGSWALRRVAHRGTAPAYTPVDCMVLAVEPVPRTLGSATLRRLVAMPPLPAPATTGFAIVQYARTATLTVATHTEAPHARLLADAFGGQLAALARGAASRKNTDRARSRNERAPQGS